VSTWARDFASEFHGFYRDCKVLSDDAELTQARLWLTEACRVGLANALGVLGVNAPDEMTRLDRDDEEDE
jgi:arginyl-tRNA synthetase